MNYTPEEERLIRNIGEDLKVSFQKIDRIWYIESYPSKGRIEVSNKRERTKYSIVLARDSFIVAVIAPEKEALGAIKIKNLNLVKDLTQAILAKHNHYIRQKKLRQFKVHPYDDPLSDIRRDRDPYPWYRFLRGEYMKNIVLALLKKKSYRLLGKLVRSRQLGEYENSRQ